MKFTFTPLTSLLGFVQRQLKSATSMPNRALRISLVLVTAFEFSASIVADSASDAARGELGFPDFTVTPIEGAPELSAPFMVMGGDKPVLTEKHGLAAPALWDWNGDGKRDLLVGDFETNSGEDFPMGEEGSAIRVYLNIGTDSDPKFSSEFEWARDTEGTVMEVPQWCCIGFTPYFYDLDDDGYEDMITGQYHPGEVSWFRGSADGFQPRQLLPQEGDPASNWNGFGLNAGERPDEIETFEYWVYSSAAMGDFDDDGDFDLVTGGSSLRLSENIGGRKRPSFARRELLLTVSGEPLVVRERSEREKEMLAFLEQDPGAPMMEIISGDSKVSPYVVDWDNDGVLDLLVTDTYVQPESNAVSFFKGVKTSEGHRFEPAVDLFSAEPGVKVLPGSGQRVYVDDWNNDGVNDLLIGASVATVNGGVFSDELSWEWEAINEVEAAGKDPGRYPPRERPTAALMKAQYEEFGAAANYTDEEFEQMAAEQATYWDETIGKLYEEGKSHWLTMRHQGRIYVMLGSDPDRSARSDVRSTTGEDTLIASRATGDTDNDGTSSYPVQLSFTAPESLARGEESKVAVTFKMAPGWYIYAPTGRNTKEGMIETQTSFEFDEGLAAVGEISLPSYQYKGQFDIFKGDTVWSQAIECLSDASSSEGAVTTTVTFQTCKNDLCLPPRTETLQASIAIE